MYIYLGHFPYDVVILDLSKYNDLFVCDPNVSKFCYLYAICSDQKIVQHGQCYRQTN